MVTKSPIVSRKSQTKPQWELQKVLPALKSPPKAKSGKDCKKPRPSGSAYIRTQKNKLILRKELENIRLPVAAPKYPKIMLFPDGTMDGVAVARVHVENIQPTVRQQMKPTDDETHEDDIPDIVYIHGRRSHQNSNLPLFPRMAQPSEKAVVDRLSTHTNDQWSRNDAYGAAERGRIPTNTDGRAMTMDDWNNDRNQNTDDMLPAFDNSHSYDSRVYIGTRSSDSMAQGQRVDPPGRLPPLMSEGGDGPTQGDLNQFEEKNNVAGFRGQRATSAEARKQGERASSANRRRSTMVGSGSGSASRRRESVSPTAGIYASNSRTSTPKSAIAEDEESVINTSRALTKKREKERRMWRYSSMGDAERVSYLKNKLRAQEMLKRIRDTKKEAAEEEESSEEEDAVPEKELVAPVIETRRISDVSEVAKKQKVKVLQERLVAEKYVQSVPAADRMAMPFAHLQAQFVKDFAKMEVRALKEYENYWDMHVRNIDVIPKHLIKPFRIDQACDLAWNCYLFFKDMTSPLFPSKLTSKLLILAETEWSEQDKLTEIQRIFAKLPKPVFLLLKSTMTHLCRIAVAPKVENHLFRALSSALAPQLFRISSRQNVISEEEKYLLLHPEYKRPQDVSIDTLDKTYKGSNRIGSAIDSVAVEDDSDRDGPLVETAANGGVGAAHRGNLSTATKHTKRTLPKSVRVSIQTGITGSSAPEIENLWDEQEEGKKDVPGFKSSPSSNRFSLPPPSPKSVPSIREAEEDSNAAAEDDSEEEVNEDSDQFNDWVKKQMQEATRLYRERKYGGPSSENENEKTGSQESLSSSDSGDDGNLPAVIVEDLDGGNDAVDEEAKSMVSEESRAMSNITSYSKMTSMEAAGIRIEITKSMDAEYYFAQSIHDKQIASTEINSLLEVINTSMLTLAASENVERMPSPKSITSVKSEGQENSGNPSNEGDGNISDNTDSDNDASVPDKVSKQSFASKLLLESECLTATASILELILKSIDIVFEYNMYTDQDRCRRASLTHRYPQGTNGT